MAESKRVFHGSPNKFTDFDFDFVGTEAGTSGAGFGLYFTESEAEALIYGENIYECILTLKTQISNHDITLTKEILNKIISKINDLGYNYLENWGIQNIIDLPKNIFNKIVSACDCDTEIIGSFINAGCPIKTMMQTLTELGYDHTVDEKESVLTGIRHYIVYDTNSINILNINTPLDELV